MDTKKKLRIAFFTSHINKSLQWLWYFEALELINIYQIHIIINPVRPLLVGDLANVGVKTYYLQHNGIFSHFVNFYKSIRILKKHKINIVHTSLPYGNLIGQTSALILRIKNRITTCENASWAHDFKHLKQKIVDSITFKLAKKIIAVSESAYEYLMTTWNVQPNKLVLINHGLKEESYSSPSESEVNNLKRQLNIDSNDFIVGMVARLEHWKGHVYAIRAIGELVQKYENIKLIIVGSNGPEFSNISELINKLNLQNHVFYKGFVENSILLYQVFDIHLHVPIDKYVENCGINIIEGMISDRPQILTLSGYAAQSAINEKNCLVVNYQDEDSIAHAIERMYLSESLRLRLAKSAKKLAINEYSLNKKVSAHLELYESTIYNDSQNQI